MLASKQWPTRFHKQRAIATEVVSKFCIKRIQCYISHAFFCSLVSCDYSISELSANPIYVTGHFIPCRGEVCDNYASCKNLLHVKEFTIAIYICRFDSEHNRRVRCELHRESRSQEEEFGKQMIESMLF